MRYLKELISTLYLNKKDKMTHPFSIFLISIFLIVGFPRMVKAQDDNNAVQKVSAILDSLEQIQRVDYNVQLKHTEHYYKIRVRNQRQFENLSNNIIEALNSGKKNILVKFKKGFYYFSDEHLNFINLYYPEVDITFEGKGVTMVPKGWLLKDGDKVPVDVNGESCFVDLKNKRVVTSWEDMMYADSPVEVVDVSKKICRIKCDILTGVKLQENNNAYLALTRWCRCYQYKITKLEDGFVYFYAHDLAKDAVLGTKDYNVNYDFSILNKYPRIRICNVTDNASVSIINRKVHLSKGYKALYLGNTSNFCNIKECQFRQLRFKGFSFVGNNANGKALVEFRDLKTLNVEFSDCCFVGQRGRIMFVYKTDNLFFHNNYIADNYEWGIVSEYNSSNTIIENCTFENNGTGLSYARCVSCFGTDYYIGYNTFKNFGYCAISVGLPYGDVLRCSPKGIVEYNHMYYDKQYFVEAWKHTIMDSGAIYIWTQNEGAIIRYNYIHDYTGMVWNRGIFCDDGAHHVAIYGNVVVNIPNSNSIDSRRVAGTESANNNISHSRINNINNVIMYNITDGTINFVGNEKKQNGCVKGLNIILKEDKSTNVARNYSNSIRNLEIKVPDKEINNYDYDEDGLLVSESGWRILSELPCFENMKRIIRTSK